MKATTRRRTMRSSPPTSGGSWRALKRSRRGAKMSDRNRFVRALLRKDFASFVHKCFATIEPGKTFQYNWHIYHIAWQLSRVRTGECRRLIINIPPRHLKSICVSVAFPAWLLGHDPSLKILAIRYAEDFAEALAGQFRAVVESSWYRKTFPG